MRWQVEVPVHKYPDCSDSPIRYILASREKYDSEEAAWEATYRYRESLETGPVEDRRAGQGWKGVARPRPLFLQVFGWKEPHA